MKLCSRISNSSHLQYPHTILYIYFCILFFFHCSHYFIVWRTVLCCCAVMSPIFRFIPFGIYKICLHVFVSVGLDFRLRQIIVFHSHSNWKGMRNELLYKSTGFETMTKWQTQRKKKFCSTPATDFTWTLDINAMNIGKRREKLS